MIELKYLLFAQYPALFLMAVLFLVNFLIVRKRSAVKSTLWVLLFAAALVAGVVFVILGMQQEYWTLKTLVPFGVAGWVGIGVVIVALIAYVVHRIEVKHNKRVMEKELKKAEKAKDDAVAQAEEHGREAARQAHEEGRKAAREEAEAVRLSRAAEAADAEVAASELASEVKAPIALTLDTTTPAEPAPETMPDEAAEQPVADSKPEE